MNNKRHSNVFFLFVLLPITGQCSAECWHSEYCAVGRSKLDIKVVILSLPHHPPWFLLREPFVIVECRVWLWLTCIQSCPMMAWHSSHHLSSLELKCTSQWHRPEEARGAHASTERLTSAGGRHIIRVGDSVQGTKIVAGDYGEVPRALVFPYVVAPTVVRKVVPAPRSI